MTEPLSHSDEFIARLNEGLKYWRLQITRPSNAAGTNVQLCTKKRCSTCARSTSRSRFSTGRYHTDRCSGFEYWPMTMPPPKYIDSLKADVRALAKTQSNSAYRAGQQWTESLLIENSIDKGGYWLVEGIAFTPRFATPFNAFRPDAVESGIFMARATIKGYFKKTLQLKSLQLKRLPIDYLEAVQAFYAPETKANTTGLASNFLFNPTSTDLRAS